MPGSSFTASVTKFVLPRSRVFLFGLARLFERPSADAENAKRSELFEPSIQLDGNVGRIARRCFRGLRRQRHDQADLIADLQQARFVVDPFQRNVQRNLIGPGKKSAER